MRISVILAADREITLPIQYNHILQGLTHVLPIFGNLRE